MCSRGDHEAIGASTARQRVTSAAGDQEIVLTGAPQLGAAAVVLDGEAAAASDGFQIEGFA